MEMAIDTPLPQNAIIGFKSWVNGYRWKEPQSQFILCRGGSRLLRLDLQRLDRKLDLLLPRIRMHNLSNHGPILRLVRIVLEIVEYT